MPAIPQYALGRHFTQMTIQGMSNTAGTLALAGSAVVLAARKKGFDHEMTADLEDINGDGSTVKNNVVIADDQSVTYEILTVNNGSDPLPLQTLFLAYGYFTLSWTVGTGSSQRQLTAIMVRENHNLSSRGRGAIMGSASFRGVDVDSGYLTVTTP